MGQFTKSQIVEALSQSTVLVTYTKVSTGQEAKMYCTLQEALLPPRKNAAPAPSPSNDDVVKVFCPDVGWRSFRVDSVISIE